MRKLIVSMNVSLNGCMAGPYGELDWHYSYWDEGMARAAAWQLGQADSILLGRITYQAMAGYWPVQGNKAFGARQDIDFADMMNSYTKVVFSGTLTKAGGWCNSRLARQGVLKEVTALKHLPGKDMIIYGSGKIVEALGRRGLIDEYRLWVHPVLIDRGRPLFRGIRAKLEFTGKQEFATGVVLMCYKAALKNQ